MAKPPEVKSVIKTGLLSGPLKDCIYYFPFQNKSCPSYTEESEKATHREQPRVLCGLGFFECFFWFVFKDWYIQTSKLLISPVKHTNSPRSLPLFKFYLFPHSTLLVLSYQGVTYSHFQIQLKTSNY